MKFLFALVGLFFFAQAEAAVYKKVCYENKGAYVANVKFKVYEVDTRIVRLEQEHRRIWFGDERKCVDYRTSDYNEQGLEKVKVRVERYMFLGNATLRHTCTEIIELGAAVVWSGGTTVNASCDVDRF